MEAAQLGRVPFPVGRRGRVLLAILVAAALSWYALGLSLADVFVAESGRGVLARFLAGAVHPAVTYEAAKVPDGTPPLLLQVVRSIADTIVLAAGGMGLALVLGFVLGFFGASSWWADEGGCGRARWGRFVRCRVLPVIYGAVRVLIVLMRSVHELLWAVLFLAAFGLNSFGAVIAIAIPYGGTLAKVFSEMLDECPRESARSLRAIGARPLQVFLFGLLPRALGDMSAYAFYRFECAVRSSAVLGFFGYPTLGYYLRQAADNLHYREVWTYLYALFLVVLLFEAWSAQLRRRIVLR
ncbi:MAG TPA: ABC transporter permease subunit [Planctomycetes bacterium]|nr:ABC transporter permease subunit [Planctomycetota bacterium]